MIVVDTHVLLWWVNGSDTLSTEATVALERECDSEQGLILVSSISVWEIAMLMSKDRLRLGMDLEDWLETVRRLMRCGSYQSTTRWPCNQRVCPAISILIRRTG